ncbi:MAG: type I pullulanase [Actinomycetaceae bacterium]|nr:type I pullulanase [Actinomycetaceae bacterium]
MVFGASYSVHATSFRLWAPTAQRVDIVDYTRGQPQKYPMRERGDGVWETERAGDLDGMVYRYRLTFPDGTVRESVDPYARAVTVNGGYGVVVDADSIGDAGPRMPSFPAMQEAIIYEAHVRDLTIGPDNGITHKGKFLGLAEPGTRTAAGNLSGLDYLCSLGVTHIQLLPLYDFGSVDEAGDLGFNEQYNWGYDPVNYNVPEGSYATNPRDPHVRIAELKELIRTLHEHGLYVIMDVVYNHAYDALTSVFERTAPGYYFRMDQDGDFYDGTGVGNEIASEAPMMRKFIVDSVRYWAQQYNLDGFRFDLMGVHDVQTMRQVRAALDEIDPSIIIIGEGWKMGNHPAGVTPANYFHASELERIGFFNDDFRDLIKGSVFDAADPGLVSGSGELWRCARLFTNITGAKGIRDFSAPAQSVVYNEAHDNFTMYDTLCASLPNADADEIARRHRLATTIQYLAQGTLFLHAGQEFLRTKAGDHNSYRSPDSVNVFDYDRAVEYAAEVDYVRMLNAFRTDPANAWLRMESYSEIHDRYVLLWAEPFHLSYRVKDAYPGADVFVFINADTRTWYARGKPAGKYEVLLGEVSPAGSTRIAIAPLSVVVLREK